MPVPIRSRRESHARAAQSLRVGRRVYTRYRVAVQEDLLGGTGQAELDVLVPGGIDRSGPHPLEFTVGDVSRRTTSMTPCGWHATPNTDGPR